jgi:5'-3' exonuclease
MAHAPVDEQRSRRFKSADPGAAAEVVITEGADVATEQVADISATATNVAVTDISAAVGRSNIG